jgi:hypothetical protein
MGYRRQPHPEARRKRLRRGRPESTVSCWTIRREWRIESQSEWHSRLRQRPPARARRAGKLASSAARDHDRAPRQVSACSSVESHRSPRARLRAGHMVESESSPRTPEYREPVGGSVATHAWPGQAKDDARSPKLPRSTVRLTKVRVSGCLRSRTVGCPVRPVINVVVEAAVAAPDDDHRRSHKRLRG